MLTHSDVAPAFSRVSRCRRKVKVVVLPGATVSDIPMELAATAQRFEVGALDEAGLEDLLRTLAGRPAYVPPPVGTLPPLRPKVVGRQPNPRAVKRVVGLPLTERKVSRKVYSTVDR